ncbi:MAG TPA: hypothetical protein VHX68_11225 [Planctomycetaceae bacterium]|nr:hypothetical protein [Planctomycetaceae bacterium]
MSDLLSRMNFGELIALISIGGGLLIALVAVAGGMWTNVRKAEIEADLKHEMLNRGMTAEEIRTVIDAGTDRSAAKMDRCHSGCA